MKSLSSLGYGIVLMLSVPLFTCTAAEVPDLKALISTMKNDPKGPYDKIRWYCPDGQILPANRRCPMPGGLQHAALKPEIAQLGEKQGIFLGQILAGTEFESFLDREHYFSRMKQYQIEKYLQRVDDGWIIRKARYYRGAVQHENESAWADAFITFCLSDPELIVSQYYLLRQAVAMLPLEGAGDHWGTIRARSAALSDHYPPFSELRVKLHGQPEPGDTARLHKFQADHETKMSPEDVALLIDLIRDMDAAYSRDRTQRLKGYLERLPRAVPSRELLRQILAAKESLPDKPFGATCWGMLSDLLLQLRIDLLTHRSSDAGMTMLALSLETEEILFQETTARPSERLEDLLGRITVLVKGCVGSGLIELWEWRQLSRILDQKHQSDSLDSLDLRIMADESRRGVQWATAMIMAVYGLDLELFSTFEPLASGFIDDRVRSSLLLPLGLAVGRLQALCAGLGETGHELPIAGDTSGVRGLNPGFALGELRVIEKPSPEEPFSDRNIYVMRYAPADLKPVAGIATVTEGNLVSHVQLLARNLGIPNAVVSDEVLKELFPLNGHSMFYAVSPGGTVVMKPAEAMTARERNLVVKRQRSAERVRIPVDRLELDQTGPVALSRIGASDSGRLCGPKAANLGQLKRIFPEYVGQGIVIPFGVFRKHMDGPMTGQNVSYWQYLHQTFIAAADMRHGGNDETQVEEYIFDRLAVLRKAIGVMPLLGDFVSALRVQFETLFAQKMGDLPVFVRSDTNMEDLKDFTGAGLNLTVFNVRESELILQAIRDVWASPYTERSFRWRQKFLENPENVYPSILILPTVPVEKSGVMITAGLSAPNRDSVTVAFSRGSGGAVEGQAAESYLIRADGTAQLLAPSREPRYRLLPETGGVSQVFTSFESAVLSAQETERLYHLANTIRQRMADSDGIGTQGPFDVELGFYKGDIRLFQIRPYVENKAAAVSGYLKSLDPPPVESKPISPGLRLQ